MQEPWSIEFLTGCLQRIAGEVPELVEGQGRLF